MGIADDGGKFVLKWPICRHQLKGDYAVEGTEVLRNQLFIETGISLCRVCRSRSFRTCKRVAAAVARASKRLCAELWGKLERRENRHVARILIPLMACVFSAAVSQADDRLPAVDQNTPFLGMFIGIDIANTGCLRDELSNLDQSKLNWEHLGSLEELDACLFWVAKSFSDSSRLVAWMKSNGLKVSEPSIIPSRSMKVIYNDERPGTQVIGSTKPRDVNFNPGFFELLFVYGMSVGIVLDADDVPIETRSTLNRL
ncbi:MAG: hypothetical protein AAF922_18830 [Pseudomonadota bacterium]